MHFEFNNQICIVLSSMSMKSCLPLSSKKIKCWLRLSGIMRTISCLKTKIELENIIDYGNTDKVALHKAQLYT